MSSSAKPRGAVLALLATILIWAYSWVVMKQAMRHAGPFDFAALRYLLGALVLFAVLLATRQSLRPPPLGLTVLIGLGQTAAFQGLVQWALVDAGAGRVALLAYTMPFWAVLLAWPLLAQQPSRRHWLAMALAGLGLVFVIEPWHGMGRPLSTVLAIAGGAAWAVGTVLSKRMFQHHRPSPLNLTAWQMLFGGLALGLLALCVPQKPTAWSLPFAGLLLYSAVIASSLAWGLWLIVIERMSTAVASLASLGVPIVSVLLAWPLLHERPSPAEAIGALLIVAGVAVVSGLPGIVRRRAGRQPG